jgi:hypothetical protein
MGALLVRLLTWLGSALGIQMSASVAQFLASKIVLYTLFIVILPIVLNNLLVSLYKEIMDLVATQSGNLSGVNATLSGCTGYLAGLLYIPQCFSMIFSALAFRVSLRLIPFIRL